MLTPEQQAEETKINQEALVILDNGIDFSSLDQKTLEDTRDLMDAEYQKYSPMGYNCLGIIAVRNRVSAVLRSRRLQSMGVI